MKLEKPKTPSRTLKDMAKNVIGYGAKIEFFNCRTEFPCINCRGRGNTREYTGIGNDYEYDDCHVCNRTGKTNKIIFKAYFDNVWYDYRKKLELFEYRKRKLKIALSKLNDEEIKLIKSFEL